MDFSRIGVVEADGAAYCAHAQMRVGGKNRNIRGPYRPDQQAAQVDFDSMREAARDMSREDGYAAMDVEADALKAGKPPSKQGSVEPLGAFTGGPPLQAPLAMCPLRGFAQAPLSSYPFFNSTLSFAPFRTNRTNSTAFQRLVMYPLQNIPYRPYRCTLH